MADRQDPIDGNLIIPIQQNEQRWPWTYAAHDRLQAYSPPTGPKRTTHRKKNVRSSPNSTSQLIQPKPIPSPDSLTKLPTTLCLLMDCTVTVPHGHKPQEISKKLGWTSTAEDILSGTLTMKPDVEGIFENLYLKITTWRTPIEADVSKGKPGGASSLLGSRNTGTEDLRSALPKITSGEEPSYPKRRTFTRGGFVPLLERKKLAFDEDGKAQETNIELGMHEVAAVIDQLASINIGTRGESSANTRGDSIPHLQ